MYRPQIEAAALAQGLDPLLVTAMVQVESGYQPTAWNPEPHYRYFWNVRDSAPFRALVPGEVTRKYPPADFPCLAGDPDQEWWAQQASWGLLQVMGAVARERGCREPYLPALCDDITLNLEIGCAHLRYLFARAHGEVDKAVGAYNAGWGGWDSAAGRRYRVKVFAALEELRAT
jgi:hypothetical protein